jgi:hypothetical protein
MKMKGSKYITCVCAHTQVPGYPVKGGTIGTELLLPGYCILQVHFTLL